MSFALTLCNHTDCKSNSYSILWVPFYLCGNCKIVLCKGTKMKMIKNDKKPFDPDSKSGVLCEHTKNGVTECSANLSKVESQSTLPTYQKWSHKVLCQPSKTWVTE